MKDYSDALLLPTRGVVKGMIAGRILNDGSDVAIMGMIGG